MIKYRHSGSNSRKIIFVTVAGRSNALSGVVACNTQCPVIACPPFKDKIDSKEFLEWEEVYPNQFYFVLLPISMLHILIHH